MGPVHGLGVDTGLLGFVQSVGWIVHEIFCFLFTHYPQSGKTLEKQNSDIKTV